ncbi:MAG: hypothetical protein Q4P71_05135 [Actinomycetaceae bacterium]|nr:hypothetical protein [Actinomycetaceae bacterium]
MPLESWLERGAYVSAHTIYGSPLDPHAFVGGTGADGNLVYSAQVMATDGTFDEIELVILPRDADQVGPGVSTYCRINGTIADYWCPNTYRRLSHIQDIGLWYEWVTERDAHNRQEYRRSEHSKHQPWGGDSLDAQLERISLDIARGGELWSNSANFLNAKQLEKWLSQGHSCPVSFQAYPVINPLGIHRDNEGNHIHFRYILERFGEVETSHAYPPTIMPKIYDVSGMADMGSVNPRMCALAVNTEGAEITSAVTEWGIPAEYIEPYLGERASEDSVEWYAVTTAGMSGFILVPKTAATLQLTWDNDGAHMVLCVEDENLTALRVSTLRTFRQNWAHWIDEFYSLDTHEVETKIANLEARLRKLDEVENQ